MKICYQELTFPFPLKNRETIVCGYGVNRMETNGTVLVMTKSMSVIDDPKFHERVGQLEIKDRAEGLVENIIHFYGFEISPVSATEVSLRCCMLVDPQIPLIPDSLIDYGSKKFGEDMLNKMLQFSQNIKGTQYEERLKSTENADFYKWLKFYVVKYFEKKGWQYDFPEY